VRRIDRFVAVSELTRDRFVAWSGVSAAKAMLLPNCFEPENFTPGPKAPELVARYGLQGKTVLLTVGRLDSRERYKGFDEVLDLLPTLRQRIPEIAYLIVGHGNDRERLEHRVDELGLRDQVVFAGYVEETEKTAHYRLADAYVMPSRGEGFGIVYLEAMACGIPVVGSRVDGSREALRDGLLGLLVDPSQPAEIEQAIYKALDTPQPLVPAGLDYFSAMNYVARVQTIVETLSLQYV
jgi:glycosyltransferase involved in cell wall biosynthesis